MKIEHEFPLGRRVRVCDQPQINDDCWSKALDEDCGREFIVAGHKGSWISLSTRHRFQFKSKWLTLLPLEIGRDIAIGSQVTITKTHPGKDKDGFVPLMQDCLGKTGEIEYISIDGKFIKLRGIPFHFSERWIIPLVRGPMPPRGSWVRLKAFDDFGILPGWWAQAQEHCSTYPVQVADNHVYLRVLINGLSLYFPPHWFEPMPPQPTGWVELLPGETKDGVNWDFDREVGRCFIVYGNSPNKYAVKLQGVPGEFHPSWLRSLDHLPAPFHLGTPVKVCDRPPDDQEWKPFMDLLCGQRSYVTAIEEPAYMQLAIAPGARFISSWLTPTADKFDAVSMTDSIIQGFHERIVM